MVPGLAAYFSAVLTFFSSLLFIKSSLALCVYKDFPRLMRNTPMVSPGSIAVNTTLRYRSGTRKLCIFLPALKVSRRGGGGGACFCFCVVAASPPFSSLHILHSAFSPLLVSWLHPSSGVFLSSPGPSCFMHEDVRKRLERYKRVAHKGKTATSAACLYVLLTFTNLIMLPV